MTASLPEVVAIARRDLRADAVILDGEVVAVGRAGRPLPFQELMRRFRRVHEVEAAAREVPPWRSTSSIACWWMAVRSSTSPKTFKGLTDEEFEAMTARLRHLAVADDGYTITVRPEVVVEVAYNEMQRSPQYASGFALRFARITRIREDKSPAEATTLADLRALYDKQFVAKGRRDL